MPHCVSHVPGHIGLGLWVGLGGLGVGAISTICTWTQVEQRLGPAAESLEALLAEGQAGTFDLAFIGALTFPHMAWLLYLCHLPEAQTDSA